MWRTNSIPREWITGTRKKSKPMGTRANYAARAYASPRPPNGQFVFADCLYLGTLSRPEIAVSSFHLGRKGITRERGMCRPNKSVLLFFFCKTSLEFMVTLETRKTYKWRHQKRKSVTIPPCGTYGATLRNCVIPRADARSVYEWVKWNIRSPEANRRHTSMGRRRGFSESRVGARARARAKVYIESD